MSKKNYFRFRPSNAPELELFCRKVIPNYLTKTLQVDMVDSVDGSIHRWIEELTKNQMMIGSKLELFNEDGSPTIEIYFSGVELLDHEFNVSYDDEDENQRSHALLFSYENMYRQNAPID